MDRYTDAGDVVRIVYVEPSDRVTSCVKVYGLRGLSMNVAWRTWMLSRLGRDEVVVLWDAERVVRDAEMAIGRDGSLPILKELIVDVSQLGYVRRESMFRWFDLRIETTRGLFVELVEVY